ncbi:MAG: polyprenyl synthetase family protein [Solirubrobacteraceae bacterium]|nr:polyprenyl synthetase family protein [Solirubrobacteraceae bacterium]
MTAAADLYPDELRLLVDRELAELRFGEERSTDGIREAMRYSVLAGGKRVRPVLALATARAIGIDPARILPVALAVELIHTYSLIHDDLPAMDDDDLRRGRPTCHKAFGEDVAILAGDALYAEAFALLLGHQTGEPADVLAASARLATATGVDGMVGGQYLDVKDAMPNGVEGLRLLHALKTGRLIGASVECVLLATGAPAEQLVAYQAFAAELGVLFQVVDDILDVTQTAEELGKPQGSDERHGKRTYVSEFGLDGARDLARDAHAHARELLAAAAPAGDELARITDYIATRSS